MVSPDDKRKNISKALRARQSGTIKAPIKALPPSVEAPKASLPPHVPVEKTPSSKAITLQDYDIESFESLETLNKHLTECYKARSDFHLTSRSPDKDIFKFVTTEAENEGSLDSFKLAFNILTLTHNINMQHNRSTPNFEHEALNLLSFYGNKISELLKIGSPQALNQIENFYRDFNQNKQIAQLRNQEISGFTIFSISHRLHDIIVAIDNKYKRLSKGQELQKLETSQMDYAQLLDVMLEGGSPESVIPLLRPAAAEQTTTTSLLPKTEFDVPSAEPEHPDRIGINNTMTFNQPEGRPTILDSFSTAGLKEEFLNSFSWAADLDSLQNFTHSKHLNRTNILGTDFTFSPIIQMAVMRYLLLSLDALGKVCGNGGDLAIQNYPVVKDITDRLQRLSDRLTEMSLDEDPHFIQELKVMTHYLVSRNQAFYNMQKQYNPSLEVRSNSELNGFCHINERLAAKILNIVFKRSVLTPDVPPASLAHKIERAESPSRQSSKKIKPKPAPAA